MTRTIPINNGYFNCKSINKKIFKSRIQEYDYDVAVTADTLTLEGSTYIVGEGNISLKVDKSLDDFTKILVLNMLSKFVEGSSGSFNLVLTSPPLLYRQQKEALPKYLKGKYNIVANGKEMNIEIKNIVVFPETVTAYFSNLDNFENPYKKILIIDIGGLTTNGALFSNGTFSADSIFTIENGMYQLDNNISQYLNGKHLIKSKYSDINEYREYGLKIRGGHHDMMVLEKNNIDKIYHRHIDKIIEQCNLRNWDVDTSEVLVTGGGGKILFDTIKKKYLYQAKISKDPVFDNLNGLQILAKKLKF